MSDATAGRAQGGLLFRLGLHRPEIRAWVMYDWANSAFWASIIQIYPFYFVRVAHSDVPPATANAHYATATFVAMLVIAVVSPVLGAIADYAGIKKKMLAAFLVIGVPPTAALYMVGPGEWKLGLALFILGNIGVAGTIVFYEALLPHVAAPDEVDRVSATGYAAGYLGSGLLMAMNLMAIQRPAWFGLTDSTQAMRLAFVTVAVWWAVFSIPLFRRVSEPPVRAHVEERRGRSLVTVGFAQLWQTLKELRGYRQAVLLLVAFLIYNDGIQTIIRMAAPYGAELGLPEGALIGSLLLVQFVGIPFAMLFGQLAAWIGPKRAIFVGLVAYVGITITGYYMTTVTDFMVLATMVGMVMGGTQALSRSLFASMIPLHKSAEFFAFYGVFEKFASMLGPALFAVIISRTGSSRNAILATAVFFVVGGALLALVDVEAGRRAAREATADRPA